MEGGGESCTLISVLSKLLMKSNLRLLGYRVWRRIRVGRSSHSTDIIDNASEYYDGVIVECNNLSCRKH